jgi:hypothetical protein
MGEYPPPRLHWHADMLDLTEAEIREPSERSLQPRGRTISRFVLVRLDSQEWGQETLLSLDRRRIPHIETFIAAPHEGVLADQ